MSDPLGALPEGDTSKKNSELSVQARTDVFRRRLLANRTQSLIVNPNDPGPTSLPPPPPPPEYAPPNPPSRGGNVLGHPGPKAPVGLVTSTDGGRNITSQVIPTAPAGPKSFAAAAAAVEQRLLHKANNGQGGGPGAPGGPGGGEDDPSNGSVRSPLRHSMGYRPSRRQRQPSSDPPGRQCILINLYLM